jgi:hypothetical protein
MQGLLAIGDIIEWLVDPEKRFLISVTLGALSYLVTSVLSYGLLLYWSTKTKRILSSAEVNRIHITCALWVDLFC